MERIEIYTSKKKSIWVLICSIALVALGIWVLLEADNLTGWKPRNPILPRIIGIASILFFGFGIFAGIKRVIKSEIALIIDSIGVDINPKIPSTEYIKWEEILGFEEIKIHGTRIIIVRVIDSNSWLEKETRTIRKKLMQFNVNTYDSPFNIASSGLDISSAELMKKLNTFFNKYKNEA